MKRTTFLIGSIILFLSLGAIMAVASFGWIADLTPAAGSIREGAAPESPPVVSIEIENVFLVVIDGVRASEAFDDPTHEFIPHIWNDLAPKGTICTDVYSLGNTNTTSGHYSMMSGVAQHLANTDNIGLGPIPVFMHQPSIFQYYCHKYGVPQEKMWNVSGKGINTYYAGISLNPFYRDDFAPLIAMGTKHYSDELVWQELQTIMDTHHPSLVFVNLQNVDGMGHRGDWDLYTGAIQAADQIVYDLYQKIESDPHYRRKTALIVTTDHGRHLDGVYSGFKDHGCTCLGCRKVMLLAVGPTIKKNKVIDQTHFLSDIAPTIGHMLGFETMFSEAHVIRDMLINPPPEPPLSMTRPDVACSGSTVYICSCVRQTGKSDIGFSRSLDNGYSWSDPVAINEEERSINDEPSVVAEGSKVGAAWTSYHADNGAYKVAVRESLDLGETWSDVVYFNGVSSFSPDTRANVSYRQGLLNVVWYEAGKSGVQVRHATVQDGAVLSESELPLGGIAGFPRACSGTDGTHAVYMNLDSYTIEWEVCYSYHDGSANAWDPPVNLTDTTSNHGYSADVTADSSGIHAVWAENDGGLFEIVARNSTDGLTWDSPAVLSNPTLGSWHPRIASNDNRIVVVWEDYDNETPHILGATSTDGGITWSDPFTVTPQYQIQYLPAAAQSDQDMLHTTEMIMGHPARINYTQIQF